MLVTPLNMWLISFMTGALKPTLPDQSLKRPQLASPAILKEAAKAETSLCRREADSWCTCAGLDKLTAVQVVGCTRETLATFQQLLQAEEGFAIPTPDLGTFNMLVEADCTGLLLYETESQMLHGLWKSTQFTVLGDGEVHAAHAHPHTPGKPLFVSYHVKEMVCTITLSRQFINSG